jgi:primosomal protein N''
MAVPWLQIVQLVPSIVDVSRELLKKNRRPEPEPGAPQTVGELEARIARLEENERRQAELVNQMAEQLAALTKLVVELRNRVLWLTAGLAIAVVVAVVALFI